MSRKGQSITLSISEREKAQLMEIAREQGMLWGEEPNISRLIKAIARRELQIGRNNDWAESRIQALQQAIHSLVDAGHIEAAQTIARLLLERSEIAIPLQTEIEQFLQHPPPPWRLEIDQYILCQQPFQLTYQDAAQRLWTFTIRHARISHYERRQYLECWCEETAGNRDLPELQHNWTLRLDRIPDLALTRAAGPWRTDLDRIDVEIHLSGGLAFAYESKANDRVNEWIADRPPPVRRVVRQVSNSFWFLREIFRYGKDCVIVSPEAVRDRFKAELRSLCQIYEL
jgi:predicted DNA-binding transcriptional regulator YafY